MKKIRRYLIGIAAICMLSIGVTGCTSDLEQACFTKSLIYSYSQNFTVSYFCDEAWDKEVKAVRIVDGPENIEAECVIENEDNEQDGRINRTDLGLCLSFDERNINKDGTLKADYYFSTIEVIWDDGTCEEVNIGDVTIISIGDIGDNVLFVDDYAEDNFIVVDKNTELDLYKCPSELQMDTCFNKLNISGVGYSDILEKGSVTYSGNLHFNAEYELNRYIDSKYDYVDVFIVFKNKATKEYYSININNTDGMKKHRKLL